MLLSVRLCREVGFGLARGAKLRPEAPGPEKGAEECRGALFRSVELREMGAQMENGVFKSAGEVVGVVGDEERAQIGRAHV